MSMCELPCAAAGSACTRRRSGRRGPASLATLPTGLPVGQRQRRNVARSGSLAGWRVPVGPCSPLPAGRCGRHWKQPEHRASGPGLRLAVGAVRKSPGGPALGLTMVHATQLRLPVAVHSQQRRHYPPQRPSPSSHSSRSSHDANGDAGCGAASSTLVTSGFKFLPQGAAAACDSPRLRPALNITRDALPDILAEFGSGWSLHHGIGAFKRRTRTSGIEAQISLALVLSFSRSLSPLGRSQGKRAPLRGPTCLRRCCMRHTACQLQLSTPRLRVANGWPTLIHAVAHIHLVKRTTIGNTPRAELAI
jgi:hypothetical protein